MNKNRREAEASNDAGRGELSRTVRVIRWLNGQADRRGFYWRVGIFPVLDYALPFLPNQLLLIALAYFQPSRWLRLAATFAIGSALGAVAVALVIQEFGGGIAHWLTANVEVAGTLFELVRDYGPWALSVLALLPTPPRSAVMLCALGGMPPLQIGSAILAGRLVATSAIAWTAAESPQWLQKIPLLGAQVESLETMRRQAEI